MPDTEPTDAQIRGVMAQWWKTQFQNWGGDSLNECVNELATGETEEDEQRVYDRACELLDGAQITISWGTADDTVEPPEWAEAD